MNNETENLTNAATVETVTIDDLVPVHAETMPKPNEHVIRNHDQGPGPNNVETPIESSVVDKYGNTFDPQLHESPVPSDRTGRLVIKNRYLAKKRAGKNNPKPALESTLGELPEISGEPVGERTPQVDGNESIAVTVVAAEQALALAFFGSEWVFTSDEQKALVRAYVRQFDRSGMVELPPWLDIVVAHGVIVGSRIHKPKTKDRLGMLWLKIKGFAGKFRKDKGEKES